MTRRELHLLGPVRVESDDGDVPRFRSQRTMALLGYLVAQQRAVARDALAALFWPDEPQSKGRGSLRRELHNLSRILPDCWDSDRRSVKFAPTAATWVDLYQFAKYETARQWTAAAELVRGDFLEGLYLADNLEFETWLLGERERWRQQAESVLNRLIESHSRQARYRDALHYAWQLLQITPWNEETHRQVMLLLAWSGHRAAALKQFAICRQSLAEQLGVEPSAETLALYHSLQAAPTPPRHNLPAQATPFIGRESELATIGEHLARPDCRLLTLVGPGGIGKSRLALEAAARYHQTTAAETYVAQLDAIHSIDALVRAIAAAVGFQFSGPLEPEQQFLSGLRQQTLLLLLDSFEHLLDSVGLVSRLMAASPGLKVVVTSRQRLNLRGETQLPVRGLDYGANSQPDQSSAVELFLQRAHRRQPAYRPSPEDITAIVQICRLVEGMPLAIELAAAWIDLLTPTRILTEMEGSLAILTSQTRDRPDRHLSIRAVWAQAWERLTSAERGTLKKLSVFAGGFDQAAARQVANATIFLLRDLVDKSLVTPMGQDRYRLHALLRQFAAERLAVNPAERQQTLNQHCRYYASLMVQYELDSKTNFVSVSTNLLKTQADLDNVLAAWSRARKTALISEIGKLAYFLSLFYEFFGLSREGQVTFGDALQTLREQSEQVSPITQVRVLTHYGWFCHSIYELDRARAALEDARSQSSALGNSHRADVGIMYIFLGWVTHLQGQSSSARQFLERGLELCQAADYQLGQLITRHMLGEIEYDAGH